MYLSRLLILPLLTCCVLFAACNGNGSAGNCDPDLTCETVEPFYAAYYVKVTIDAENPEVIIAVFRGDYEDGDTVFTDLLTSEKAEYDLPVNEFYSAAAYYVRDGKTYIAIDGDRVSSSYQENCDYDCWTVTTGSVNLKML